MWPAQSRPGDSVTLLANAACQVSPPRSCASSFIWPCGSVPKHVRRSHPSTKYFLNLHLSRLIRDRHT
jgi:hypothetical protein